MAVLLKIKHVKATKEIFPTVDGKRLPTSFGMKVYSSSELPKIKEEFRDLATNEELELAQAKLLKHEAEQDHAEESFYSIRAELRNKIAILRDKQETESLAFYKRQILFVKNASFTVEDDGKATDIVVLDSSTAAPIESLWSGPDDCLPVLLDMFFENHAIRGSLIAQITDYIFDLNLAEKIKN